VAEWDVGGLVGFSHGTITNCYARGGVTGDDGIGGLVGYCPRYIPRYCYSTGRVQGGTNVGGLIGRLDEPDFESTSFWDMETSGQTVSDIARGKTTAQMQSAKTFINKGWHFAGEIANGTEDIWWIDEGRDYPRLWWEVEEKDDGTTASDD